MTSMSFWPPSAFSDPDHNPTHMGGLMGWSAPDNPNELPSVPGRDNPGEGVTAVSTEALRAYANNIDMLIPILDQARDQLDLNWIQAGNFGAATALKEKMSSKTGIGVTTWNFLEQTAETLGHIRNAARNIAAEFENAEDLNEATSADVGFQMTELKTAVGALKAGAVPDEDGAGSGSGTENATQP